MRSVSRLKALAPVLALVILSVTVFLQLSHDICPLHGKYERHSPNSSLSSPGGMCLCLLTAFFAPPAAASPFLSPAERMEIDPTSSRISLLRALDIFHPPRAMFSI